MKWYWKVLISMGALALLVVVLNIGLNYWIQFRLPEIINRKNDSVYQITYKNLKISLFDNSFVASDIIIMPKAATPIFPFQTNKLKKTPR